MGLWSMDTIVIIIVDVQGGKMIGSLLFCVFSGSFMRGLLMYECINMYIAVMDLWYPA